ncbi:MULTISPECIES: quinone oxidoreductase family protein [unclassified Bradyrhizobium]|uniref:quinone oxidoreductase family protein n=1 Tax=unclassified Bradyrhizobium TaxID=2631580 RepID=UPI002305A4BF|nr:MULTISPECIES: quinone oxidoreductase [unclassified Bradyrhizobium]MDA9451197.1 hypothetical protein [Bradyrhizobium sp. CCBAU 21360]MDA9457576.1 hypothetical protein [Bradyrhizobium sp. CCBAU 21359]
MKTVRFHRTGGPDVLTFEDVPEPVAREGEVLIKVEAVGVNFADVLRRRGDDYPEPTPLPFTPGGEIAGRVAAVGANVSGIEPGSLVYSTPRRGGYAQYVAVQAASVIPLPQGIGADQATSLVIQGLTAAFALRNSARLAKGESVFVEAAAGGVGSFAVQLAKLFGAGKVIAGASSAAKRELALRLGADSAIDYTKPDWPTEVRNLTGGAGVDVVLEMTGGDTLGRALDALGSFGRMVVYGLASGESVTVDPQRLTGPNQSVTGFFLGGFFRRPELVKSMLEEIVGYVVSGKLSLEIGATFPLSRAADAHRLIEERRSTGKIVLHPWGDT